MKHALLLLLLLLCCLAAPAQQLPQHTQYAQNNFLLNPAVAGIESYADLRAGYRTQWVGLEGAPTSFYTSLHTALGKNDRNAPRLSMRNNGPRPATGANKNNRFYVRPHHGIGAVAQAHKAGLLKTLSLNLSYAYHLPLSPTLNLSGGLAAGLTQYRLNRQALDLVTPADPATSELVDHNKADLGLGLWLYGPRFYAGLSAMQLLPSPAPTAAPAPAAALQRHYYATAGLRLAPSPRLSLTPSLMVKLPQGGTPMVDATARFTYDQRFWLAASYRHHDALAAAVGLYLNPMLDVSYSYDITTSELNRVSANSHEVVLGLKLNNKQKVLCPNWVW
ncbi:PorP/SprF family type IX secretion system membrane protein [Pontibacter sp. MBLB2868]|uniref:PorP/SprF family type IX secretion system membrane protein n=1 Tax=Pontibacter sp. MBLB2868 TaxID=3451555 RepID=UPI003F755506